VTVRTVTADPFVTIEDSSPGYIRYRASGGRRWEVHGTCGWPDPATWGPCGDGALDPVPGPPEGRLDIPVTPELVCSFCVSRFLTFRELDSV